MWPLLERHSKTVPLALRFVVLCLLLVHSVDVNQYGFCAWVRVSKTSLISSAYEALHHCCLVSHWIPNHPVVAKDWNRACHCPGWSQTDFTVRSRQNLLDVLSTYDSLAITDSAELHNEPSFHTIRLTHFQRPHEE